MYHFPVLLFIIVVLSVFGSIPERNTNLIRCRTTDDLDRIPWFAPNSTFHNLGYPLIKELCKSMLAEKNLNDLYYHLDCETIQSTEYLHESLVELRYGDKSSTIIIDSPTVQNYEKESSGTFVINAMFGLLYDLGYHPAVRHWSDSLNRMYPARHANAAMEISHQFDTYEKGIGPNPFAKTYNYITMQVEMGLFLLQYNKLGIILKDINNSPYNRNYKWIIGLHGLMMDDYYQNSAPGSHCIGANHFLGRGLLCSTSAVIPCPQYDFHQNRSREVTPANRMSFKKNIILFDNDQVDFDIEAFGAAVRALGGVDDLQVLKHEKRAKTDIPDLLKAVKISIDCRNPGVEFINYEAVLYDVLTLSCNLRATRNMFDFPVPSMYHIESKNFQQSVQLVHKLLLHYEDHVDDFKHFKRLSRSTNDMARVQVDINYFARDVLFRTSCESYAACRRVYAWSVAIWTLYPLSYIEVVVGIDMRQFRLDNDLLQETMPQQFNSKYFILTPSVEGIHPADRFPSAPCRYVVYMDAAFIPFGRDFLNTHVAALVQDPRPVLHWDGNKLVIAVIVAKPYVKVFRANTAAIFIETDLQIRSIGNYDSLLALQKYTGTDIAVVEPSYLERLPHGERFLSVHLDKWVSDYGMVLTSPCSSIKDSNITTTTPTSSSYSKANNSSGSGSGGSKHHSMHNGRHGHLGSAATSVDHKKHRCEAPRNLIIDALYVPLASDDDDNERSKDTLWLTSSAPPLSLRSVFRDLTPAQVETIVQHLDPILQNSHMQKIISFIPQDLAHALKHFDANNFPNVVSLIDMENPRWRSKY